MDRTGIIVVTLCAILLGVWFFQVQKYQSHQPPPPLTTNTATTPAPGASPSSISATTAVAPVQIFDTNAPESLIVLTNVNARYTFTSRGGGLKSVELSKYPETIPPRWKKQMATNGYATLNTGAAVPVLAILGDPGLVGDGNLP